MNDQKQKPKGTTWKRRAAIAAFSLVTLTGIGAGTGIAGHAAAGWGGSTSPTIDSTKSVLLGSPAIVNRVGWGG